MGLMSRARAAVQAFRSPQNTAFEEEFWRHDLSQHRPLASGQHVTHQTALQVTTALRCGLLISDGVSTVPCKLMYRDDKGSRRVVTGDEHPLAEVLDWQANPWMDGLQYRETTSLHTIFTGDGISFVNRVRGRVVELIPLRPECVRIEQRQDWSLHYFAVGLDGNERELPPEAVLHIRGPSWNGFAGLDIVRLAGEAIGLAMATEEAHAARFKNGVSTSGVYSIEGTLDQAGYQQLRAYIDQNMIGAERSGKPFILDRNAKWTPTVMSGVDAEHIATREFQVQEICRAFNVLPIMIGFSDKASTYASAEQMFLAHAVHTIRPWHRRFERAMMRQLLSREEIRAGYYIKFFDTELLRGAAKDRAEYYAKMFGTGAFAPNDILGFEDMDGFAGGEKHWVPANYMDPNNPIDPNKAADNANKADKAKSSKE